MRFAVSISSLHHIDFLQRIGHKIRESGGVHWFNCGSRVFSSLPYDRDVDANSIDLREILRSDGLLARFGCPIDQGVSSFRIICDSKDYDFPLLRSRTRTQVRRGLEVCRVERIEFQQLQKLAMPLNADTLIRQGRKVPSDLQSYWTRYYQQAATTQGAETWAAFVGTDLAAYLISFMIDDVANLLIVRSSSQHLESYPNNALLFRFLSARLKDADVRMVSYGYESIQSDLGSLDQFKLGMGFRKDPVGQRIEFAPWLSPLFNRFTDAVARRILRSLGRGETVAKLQGMLNWYRDQPALRSSPDSLRVA
jgi:hypothetical protein